MNIKGSAIIHARSFIQSRWGSDALQTLARTLEPSASSVFFASNVLGHGWYPVIAWNAVVEEVARWPGQGGEGAIRELAAHVAQKDLTTAYRVLLKIGTPEIIFRRAGVFWSKYFDGGTLEGLPVGEGRFQVVLRTGIDPVHDPCPLTCREAVPSWQEHAIRLTGASGGKSVHARCRFEGHPTCEYEVSWDT